MVIMDETIGYFIMSEPVAEPQITPYIEPGVFRFIETVSYLLFGIGPLVGNAVLTLLGPVSIDFLVDPTVVMIAIPSFMFPFAFFQLFSGALSCFYPALLRSTF